MIKRDWRGLYADGWNGQITSDAFAHPAKFARGLIRRIYQHALEQGYLKPGDTVLDPFGGVGLGGLDAISLGLNWMGVELEQPFNDLGTGCDCTGISKNDWVRFYDRWDRVRYRNGRYWCPRCLSEAKRVDGPDDGQLSFLDVTPSAAYIRNSGKIPHTEPHHYTGNIELWGKNGYSGRAVLLQGDSRYLCDVLGEAGGVVSSPPYAESLDRGRVDPAARRDLAREMGISNSEHISPIDMENIGERTQDYGTTPGQLGAMRVVSSPPYADGCQHTGGDDSNPEHVEGGKLYGVGISGAVSSPPYAESVGSDDPDKRGGLYRDEKRRNDKTLTAEYGQSAGQLGRMRVVRSPPYEGSLHLNEDKGKELERLEARGDHSAISKASRGGVFVSDCNKGYGEANGNLGNDRGDDFWQAARQIMQQAAQVLPPGAVAIWVVKGFIRKGEYVDFPDQWRQLGEACGFETLEWIRAWLVEDRGTQYGLFGGETHNTVQRKSFFRRLAESKGSPPIDYEVVLIQARADA